MNWAAIGGRSSRQFPEAGCVRQGRRDGETLTALVEDTVRIPIVFGHPFRSTPDTHSDDFGHPGREADVALA
jgi:hypothetical protein